MAEVGSIVTDYLKSTKEGDILKLMLALFKVLYIIDALASLFPFNLAPGCLVRVKNPDIFHLVGVLVLPKTRKILLCVSFGLEPEPCPKIALLFLGCSFLVSESPPFPD